MLLTIPGAKPKHWMIEGRGTRGEEMRHEFGTHAFLSYQFLPQGLKNNSRGNNGADVSLIVGPKFGTWTELQLSLSWTGDILYCWWWKRREWALEQEQWNWRSECRVWHGIKPCALLLLCVSLSLLSDREGLSFEHLSPQQYVLDVLGCSLCN